MKVIFSLFGILFLFSPGAHAQTRTDAPYLLPQTIFVGDPGRLIVPLSPYLSGIEPFILEALGDLPQAPDLVIRRIELERRGESSRLLIDFVPYAPGTLILPALDFLPLPNLEVQVSSILTPSQMTLSEPASPLAVPGTSFLIYGTFTLVLILLALGIAGSLWGRSHFREFWERLRRRSLLRGMTKFLRRLKQDCGLEKNEGPEYYLSLLSAESREFLSLFTGINCRPLTSGEFLELPQKDTALDPACLCRIFRTWDTLRFSGQGMEMADAFQALDEMDTLIAVLDKAEREKFLPKSFHSTAKAAGEVL